MTEDDKIAYRDKFQCCEEVFNQERTEHARDLWRKTFRAFTSSIRGARFFGQEGVQLLSDCLDIVEIQGNKLRDASALLEEDQAKINANMFYSAVSSGINTLGFFVDKAKDKTMAFVGEPLRFSNESDNNSAPEVSRVLKL